MFSSKNISDSIDLHGKSIKEAELSVSFFIKKCRTEDKAFLRIITGRGNHANHDGSRGLIYKRLIQWLEHDNLKPYIKSVEQREGSYLITLYSSLDSALESKLEPAIIRKHPNKNALGETKLSPVIENSASLEQKIQALETLIALDRDLLYETDDKGNTALMVAAANNEHHLIDFILQQESILFITPKLLKQKNYEGDTVLTFAVENSHAESVDYLLKKAPSLLKMRNNQHKSVFNAAMKAEDPAKLLSQLFAHLNQHVREKGYTGLFRDYKECMHQINTRTTHNNISKFSGKYKKLNKSKLIHKWFFSDRMKAFVNKISTSKKINLTKSIIQNITKGIKFSKIKPIITNLLKQDNKFRKFFLRFNNRIKPARKNRYKHAINHLIPNVYEPLILRKRIPKSKKKAKPNKALSTTVIQKKIAKSVIKLASASLTTGNRINAQNKWKPITPLTGYASIVAKHHPMQANVITTQEIKCPEYKIDTSSTQKKKKNHKKPKKTNSKPASYQLKALWK